MGGGKEQVRAPLLDAYLKSLPSYPDHFPRWIAPVGWAVFLTIALISKSISPHGDLGPAIGALLGWVTVLQLRRYYRGKSDREQTAERAYEIVRRLKWAQHDTGGLRKRLPSEVVVAMEDAVAAYNIGIARVTSDTSFEAAARREVLERAMLACLVAIAPVIRGNDQGRKDWKAVCSNQRMINEVVQTVHDQTMLMREPQAVDHARIAALRELNDEMTGLRVDQA